jgi:hypothetical protein
MLYLKLHVPVDLHLMEKETASGNHH